MRLPVRRQSTKIRCPNREPRLLSYPAAISLSTRTLNRLADLIRAHRIQRRCRWRRLHPGQQALLVLAHLRNGTPTLPRRRIRRRNEHCLAVRAWAVDLLAVLTDDLNACAARVSRLAYATLDGTLVPIDRVADQRPYYFGQAHTTWRERAGRSRSCRPARLGLTRSTRCCARPERCANHRSNRRIDLQ